MVSEIETTKLKSTLSCSLIDLVLYFDEFDNQSCEIYTNLGAIELKTNTVNLPHLIGMSYAYGVDMMGNSVSNKSDYSAKQIIKKILDKEITYEDFIDKIYLRQGLPVSPEQIIVRAPLLKIFFDNIKKSGLKSIDRTKLNPKERFQGDFFLYQKIGDATDPKYLVMILKKDSNPNTSEKYVFESFRLELDSSFVDRFDEVNVMAFTEMSPMKNRKYDFGVSDIEYIENKRRTKKGRDRIAA